MITKSYSEMLQFGTYHERLRYLQTHSAIGSETFGINRYFNQKFYRSSEWKSARHRVIIRDNGWDLGIEGLDLIIKNAVIHHINPITIEDVEVYSSRLFDLENLILCSTDTHRKIHYGYSADDVYDYEERTPFDTCPWKRS